MKKTLLILGIAIGMFSCDDISELNVDPKNPSEVGAEVLFTYGQYNLVKQFVNIDYNHNVDRMWSNFLTQTTYIQEASYNSTNRDIGGSHWDNIYTESLYELNDAKEVVASEEVSDALLPEKKNKLAQIRIMEVFAYQYLVDNFGSVPYTDALDVNNVVPTYDTGDYIYGAILDSLNAAIADIDVTAAGFSTSGDILYGGDMELWKKFGNSLKLKIGMRVADVASMNPGTIVSEAVAGGVFESNADNASYAFSTGQPYTNPIYDYFVVDSRASDFVVTKFFIDMLEGLSDPRIDAYLDDNIAAGYTGGIYGAEGNAYALLTHIDPALVEADYPGMIMDYAAVSFMLAEAVERGFISGTAATHYDNGVKASFESWGFTAADAAAYLASSGVAYASASGTYKEKIGRQKYIAAFNQGHEAWTEARRLNFPELLPAASDGTPNPHRLVYPTAEPLINTTNYTAASSALGGDNGDSRIFWDLN
ncbi:SusD/RagB family nutrient-binding outer membrane lipoprotein [Reichenbachiella carrageenanivorans]|uniref:SusD/RagB family nutrient-binding outer membrane lipoprotein n=1 Tax=Reichenbachiella carrageenanivorans TaxID=2979869 RepID=A0ABY6D077_9BACT|nr:SusD/RagB family nutrient-binding outer membrane lipoprotein [Reichenbachiella carrageenanivorans]UXX79566.1 SusD/RagB family nutrient-binding outer membrane lipoprotein [Reichenbachiella carrageenanivorans]